MGRRFIPMNEQMKTKIKIDPLTGCWNWTARISRNGYGHLASRGKHYLAHRISYELFKGKIPNEFTVDHLCRNRKCVNPSHLEAVTRKENILRGIGLCAINSKKTHCNLGHPLDSFGFNNFGRYRKCSFNHRKLKRGDLSACSSI